MDPVTHSLAGAALSRAGLRRYSPLATATLVIAANAPDIDIIAAFGGSYTSLAHRRGITHGPIALLVLPIIIAAVVLLYDRVRRSRGEPARALPLLALAAIGVLSHPVLDWLNTYGIRLLAPFSDRWFYGDAIFIVDPWIWLALAFAVITMTHTRRGWIGWLLLGTAATALVLLVPMVPLGAKAAWIAGVTAIVTIVRGRNVSATGGVDAQRAARERHARIALAVVAGYILAMKLSDLAARDITRRAAAAEHVAVHDLMVAPVPANPFAAEIVVRTDDGYRIGDFDWLAAERVRFTRTIPEGQRTPAVLSTLQLRQVRDFLRWSRYPFVEEGQDELGRWVRWSDARYPARRRGLSGPLVRVESAGAPR